MATQFEIDCALMAGRAYQDTRNSMTWLPVPQGWSELEHLVKDSGFEAGYFERSTGTNTEIVISFAGTGGDGDWGTNLSLYLGRVPAQFKEAADYYLSVKAANPDATITFTGHSLGGGLASLMAAFFGELATTFDQAPFASTATTANAQIIKGYLLGLGNGYGTDPNVASALARLDAFISGTDSLATRATGISNIFVQGEALQSFSDKLGTPQEIKQTSLLNNQPFGLTSTDLHSQALLTAFLLSDSFCAVTEKLPDLLPLIFDSKLYKTDVGTGKVNFIEKLVQSEAAISSGSLLDRFSADMTTLGAKQNWPSIVTDINTGNLARALMAFALQKHYEETSTSAGAGKEFFTDVTGGVQFDIASVSDVFKTALQSGEKLNLADAKGYAQYFKNYLNTLPDSDRVIVEQLLPYMQDWYVQAGASGMTATDTLNRGAFMLGGTDADTLMGGNKADMLVGNAGDDILAGGAGSDALIGGIGADTYAWQADQNAGIDTVFDTDHTGYLRDDTASHIVLTGGEQFGDNHVFRGTDANGQSHLYSFVSGDKTTGGDLIVDGAMLIKNYNPATGNHMGIDLIDAVVVPNSTTTHPIQLTALTAADQILTPTSSNITLHLGNEYDNPNIPVYQLVYESNTRTGDYKYGNAGAADPSYHQLFSTQGIYIYASAVRDGNLTAASDHFIGSASDDRIYAATAADRGGNDIIEAGAGHDQVVGGQGDDVIGGGADSDILEGNSGNDRLYADAQTGVADAIAAGNLPNTGTGVRGDWLAGGDGSDILVSSTANDVLMGGAGTDLLIAGAGNDDIMGDTNWVATRFEWTVTDQPDGTRYFYPANSNAQPTDGAADVIYAGDGADHVWGELGNDVIFGEGGADKLQGGSGNDIILSGAGEDWLYGEGQATDTAGSDYLDGGAEKDVIFGGAGDDIIVGGTGDDTLYGEAGQDTYLYNRGDGNDTIYDNRADNNVFRFGAGISANDITLRLGSLMLDLGPSIGSGQVRDTVHIKNMDQNGALTDFDQNDVFNSASIGSFEFADGTVLSTSELLARGFDLDGTNLDDTITGTNTTDRINGLDGNDILAGNDGNDILQGGAGDDSLSGGNGTDWLDGGAGNDIMIGGAGADTFTLKLGAGQDVIVNADYMDSIVFGAGIASSSVFASRSVDGLRLGYGPSTGSGQGGDSVLLAGSYPDELRFADGTRLTFDQLIAAQGGHSVAGTDALNKLIPGLGGDTTYHFNRGDGAGFLIDLGGRDTLAFGPGITAANIRFAYEDWGDYSPKFKLHYGAGDAISLLNGEQGAIERFSFADGTTYSFAELAAQQGFVAPAESSAGIQVYSSWGQIGNKQLITGTAGNDTVEATNDADIIIAGGKGDDRIQISENDGAGVASLLFNVGDGHDTINVVKNSSFNTQSTNTSLVFGGGINANSLTFSSTSYTALVYHGPFSGGWYMDTVTEQTIHYGTAGDSILIEGGLDNSASFEFADGSRHSYLGMLGLEAGTVSGGGQAGASYQFDLGSGSQVIDGNSVTVGGHPVSAVSFGAGIVPSMLSLGLGSLLIRVGPSTGSGQTGDELHIADFNPNDAYATNQIQSFQFADGTTLSYSQLIDLGFDLKGNAGDDTITGTSATDRIEGGAGNDTLNGGAGNDLLNGGLGNDTYLFGYGNGVDRVYDYDLSNNSDTVTFDASVNPGNVEAVRNGDDLELHLAGSADMSVLSNWYADNAYRIEQVKFADGTMWDKQVIASMTGTLIADQFLSDQIAPEDGAFSFTLPVAAFSETNLAYSVSMVDGSPLPAWLTFDAATQSFSGTPSNWDVGSLNLAITATNAVGQSASNKFVLNVLNVNDVPTVVGSLMGKQVVVGQAFNYALTRNGIPEQLVVNSNESDGSILQANTVGVANSYTLTGTIGDAVFPNIPAGEGWDYDFYNFGTLSVGQTVAASTFTGFDTVIGLYDAAGNLVIENDDANGAGGSTSSLDSSFSYTVTAEGNYYLAIASYDSWLPANPFDAASGVMAGQLAVGGSYTARVDISGQSLVGATNIFDDVDVIHGDSLTYGATLADGSPLPSWLTFDAATQVFSGTPANGDAGMLNVAVTATDSGGLSATSNFALTVTGNGPINVAPLALADTVNVSEDAAQTTIAAANLLANDTDPNVGDALTLPGFDVVTAQGNTVSQDAAGNLVLGIGNNYQSLGAGQMANDSFTYTVSDAAGLTSTATVAVTVAGVNDAPAVAVPIAGQQTNEDMPLSFTIPAGTFTDIDNGDILTYSATLADGTALPSWLTFDAVTQTFSGIPGNWDVGNLSVQVTATDTGGLSATSNFVLNVINVNDTPTANADAGAATEDGGAVLMSAATLFANDTDPDAIHGDTLNIVGVSQSASGAAVSLLNGDVQYDAGSLFQSLAAGQTTTDTFSYTIADAAGATSTADVTMTITGMNDASVTTADTAAAQEDITLAVSGNVLTNDTDVDQGTVLGVANAGVFAGSYGSLTLLADGSYSYALDNASLAVQSLAAGQTVTDIFAYQATDGIVTTPANLTVNITGTNDAPIVATPIAGQQTNEDAPFSFAVPTGTFTDIDNGPSTSSGQALTYSATLADGTALPSWLNFDAATQTFSGTPGNWDVGGYSVTVTATDTSGLTASSVFAVDVANINDAPTVSVALADHAALQDAAFSFVIPAGTFGDVDFIHGNTLSYGATLADGTALPAWLTFDAATGTFSGIPSNGDVGNLNVQMTATDTGGLNASSAFNLNAANVNDAPTANTDTGASTEDGGAVLLDAATMLSNDTDPDFIHGDALNIVGVSQAASGAAVSLTNGAVQYDPSTSSGQGIGTMFQSLAQGQTATDTFSYTVSDMAGATSTATVTMTVTGVNDGPVTANDAAAVQEDAALIATGNVLANDTDVDQGTVLSVADAGVRAGSYGSLNLAADGSYSYALDNASLAVQSLGRAAQVVEHFGYTATDGMVGASSVLDVFLNGANDAPILVAPLADQDFTFAKHFSWQMPEGSFTDIDQGDTLGYAATLADGSALPDWLSFDASTRAFSGETPKEVGFVDVQMVATDSVAATGSTVGSLSASDVFRISVSHGNEGVGPSTGSGQAGEDAPPPGHDRNTNDGGGTAPGRPGSKGGNGHPADSGANSHGNESKDRSSDSKASKGDNHAKDNENDDSQRTDELIRIWFEEESTSERYSSFSTLDRHGAWGGQVDRQVKRNVAKGISGDVSSEWERMNAQLKKHLEQSGGDDGHFSESGTGSRSFGLFGSGGQQGIPQLGTGNGQQLKALAGLKEGLERLGC